MTCSPAAAAGQWRSAVAVLVGVDALPDLVRLDPIRREAVYAVAAEEIPHAAWRDCVHLGVQDALSIADSEGWLVDRLALGSDDARLGSVLRIVGATGGCGASVAAAGIALASGDSGAVILDTDLRSGWIDLLLGLEPDGLGWSELSGLRGRVGGEALTASIPNRDGISLIAASRDRPQPSIPADAVRSAVLAASGLGALVLIDDHAGDAADSTDGQLSDLTILVTTSDLRGGLAARAALDALRGGASGDRNHQPRSTQPIVVAARTPRGAALSTELFAELTDGADDVVWLREVPGIDRRVTRGRPGLWARDRFVRDCGDLLSSCETLVGAR